MYNMHGCKESDKKLDVDIEKEILQLKHTTKYLLNFKLLLFIKLLYIYIDNYDQF